MVASRSLWSNMTLFQDWCASSAPQKICIIFGILVKFEFLQIPQVPMVILAQLVLVHKRHIRHTCLRLGWSGQAPPKLKNFDSLVDIWWVVWPFGCMAASKYI